MCILTNRTHCPSKALSAIGTLFVNLILYKQDVQNSQSTMVPTLFAVVADRRGERRVSETERVMLDARIDNDVERCTKVCSWSVIPQSP